MSPMLRGAAKARSGPAWARLDSGRAAHRGRAMPASELWDRVPRDEIRDHVQRLLGKAQEAIDDVVETELRDLRRAMRRQRKRLGI